MNNKDIVTWLEQNQKKLVYISGKTSTGKTTLARQLQEKLGYSVISLDKLVQESVIEKFHATDIPHAYVIAYRDGAPKQWRDSFISHTKATITSHIAGGVILEGAIANPKTLKNIVSEHLPEFIFLYIHPENISKYIERITKRFIDGAATNTSGLPKDFWKLLPEPTLNKYRKNKKITPDIKSAIKIFANKSQSESNIRLESMRKHFSNIEVIDLLD